MKQSIRVLLVDDEKRFALNLARLLQARGFETTVVFNGVEACAAVAASEPYDVVVLDVNMPEMNGIDTLKAVRRTAPESEVIILTGHASLESGIEAIREGAFDYLMKPCDIDDLTTRIQAAHDVEVIKRRPVLWPRNRVEEIAIHVIPRLNPLDPLEAALTEFTRESGENAPDTLFVLDAEGRLKGCVTKRDLINEARQSQPFFALAWSDLLHKPHWLPARPIKAIMQTEVQTAHPQARLTDVANRMITQNFRTMPVVEAGKVIGIVRLQDIFQYVDHQLV